MRVTALNATSTPYHFWGLPQNLKKPEIASAIEAAIRAGYSTNTSEQQGYQLLHKTSVGEAIDAAMNFRAERADRRTTEFSEAVKRDGEKLRREYSVAVKRQI